MATPNGVLDIVTGEGRRGEPILAVVVKRSYRIHHRRPLERAERDAPLRRADVYHDDGDPSWASVRHEHELAAMKQAVDVVVVGRAHAPRGEAVQQMTVGVRVGGRRKLVRVVGDRHAVYREGALPGFTEPEPFTTMELRYELAYGGADERSDPDMPFHYPRNTLGCGVVTRNVRASIEGLALPNLEDPDDPLAPERLVVEDPRTWPEQPLPQGLGWFQRTWYPRCALLGAYPAYVDVGYATPEERAGLLPKDHIALAMQRRLPAYQARFNNGASLGLTFEEVSDTEAIELRGLDRGGALDFTLPGETPRVSLDVGFGEQALVARLDTVSIRPDDLEADLLWRAPLSFEDYGQLQRMTRLHAEVS